MASRAASQSTLLVSLILILNVIIVSQAQITALSAATDVLCLGPSKAMGKKAASQNECRYERGYMIGYDVEGRTSQNGDCVICGEAQQNNGFCDESTQAVAYVSGGIRRCACNVGFYGNQLPGAPSAGGCTGCPTGTTTSGYGASRRAHCNICQVGYTGRNASSCVACSTRFKGPITTPGPGLNQPCVCPIGFTGTPGNCRKCPGTSTTATVNATRCICPAGGTPPNCKKCDKNGVVLNGRCECAKGYSGVWPRCTECPDSLYGYDTTTLTPGNNQTCVCDLFSILGEGPSAQANILERDARQVCKCRESTGSYLKIVPNYPGWSTDSGPCDNFIVGRSGRTKVVTLANGEKRLGCKSELGWGVNVAYALEMDYPAYCMNCTAFEGATIDTRTTKCMCRTGYAVNPFFGAGGRSTDVYCTRCTGAGYRVSKLGSGFAKKSDDLFCLCARGYDLDYSTETCVKTNSG